MEVFNTLVEIGKVVGQVCDVPDKDRNFFVEALNAVGKIFYVLVEVVYALVRPHNASVNLSNALPKMSYA